MIHDLAEVQRLRRERERQAAAVRRRRRARRGRTGRSTVAAPRPAFDVVTPVREREPAGGRPSRAA